jgi:predicted phosphohydrolase
VTEPQTALELAEYHEAGCCRYINGECQTRRCLARGGWKIGDVVDYSLATCEAHETAQLLRALPVERYLVWSNQHRAWWRPNSHGYTDNVKRAGIYSRAEAISISFRGRDGWDSPKGVPDELAIAERDVPVFVRVAEAQS